MSWIRDPKNAVVGDRVAGIGTLRGRFTCPSNDGDYTVSVYDQLTSAKDFVLIRQEGQCEIHDIVLTLSEAYTLGKIIQRM